MDSLYISIVLAPLLGFFLSGLLGRRFGDNFSQIITCGLMGFSALGAALLFLQDVAHPETHYLHLFTWIKLEFLEVYWGLQIDSLSVVMMAVVSLVSFLIHIYSIGYMRGDPGIPRFMAYLSLFTFFMLALVTSPNLVQLFFGWEGVGLCSYLLIGFWYDREAANAAAIKAFLVNRIGDVGYMLGMIAVFVVFGTLEFEALFEGVAAHQNDTFTFLGGTYHAITLATFLLFLGAMGKSAQVGLHTWLPDAMEGPTPVSALIHAATMVTAGVFLVVRLSPLIEYAPFTRDVITVVGSITAVMAATIACVQNDIKKIIAYSTCSQLGYMFMAAGLSAYSAAIFHLTTHAFFKALLFLSAGSVIHAMSSERNIQKMGGIWRLIPFTAATMWIGGLALAGIPLFAGYYSKDLIIEADWASGEPDGMFAFIAGFIGVILTAFYTWRLLILTFQGEPRASEDVMGRVHHAPLSMALPQFFLSIGAIFSGTVLFDLFVGQKTIFWGSSIFVLPIHDALERAHLVEPWISHAPVVAAVFGIGLAYLFYSFIPSWPEKLTRTFRGVYAFLVNAWYFDDFYEKTVVEPALRISKVLWKEGDQEIIDGLGPNGLAALSVDSGRWFCRLQTGALSHYAFAMFAGLMLLISWYLWL